MNYTKIDPRPAWCAPREALVKLDTGELVSVLVSTAVTHRGGLAIKAMAVVIAAEDGPAVWLDANGASVQSTVSLHACHAEDKPQAMRDAVALVLGEYTGTRFDENPSKSQLLADFSIRTNLASVVHAGDVNTAALL